MHPDPRLQVQQRTLLQQLPGTEEITPTPLILCRGSVSGKTEVLTTHGTRLKAQSGFESANKENLLTVLYSRDALKSGGNWNKWQ